MSAIGVSELVSTFVFSSETGLAATSVFLSSEVVAGSSFFSTLSLEGLVVAPSALASSVVKATSDSLAFSSVLRESFSLFWPETGLGVGIESDSTGLTVTALTFSLVLDKFSSAAT